MTVFTYGQLDEFQQYFSLLDIDGTGDLSDREINVLLVALGIEVFSIFIREIHIDRQVLCYSYHWPIDYGCQARALDPHDRHQWERHDRVRRVLHDGALVASIARSESTPLSIARQLYEIYRKDRVSAFWQGILPSEAKENEDRDGDGDEFVQRFDRRYDELLNEKDEEGGDAWGGVFSVGKVTEALGGLAANAGKRFQEEQRGLQAANHEMKPQGLYSFGWPLNP